MGPAPDVRLKAERESDRAKGRSSLKAQRPLANVLLGLRGLFADLMHHPLEAGIAIAVGYLLILQLFGGEIYPAAIDPNPAAVATLAHHCFRLHGDGSAMLIVILSIIRASFGLISHTVDNAGVIIFDIKPIMQVYAHKSCKRDPFFTQNQSN
jgi:hypothetical protein